MPSAARSTGRRRDESEHCKGFGAAGDRGSVTLSEPTPEGRFGQFGGRYVPETLIPAVLELEAAFRDRKSVV